MTTESDTKVRSTETARARDRRHLWHTWTPLTADRSELMLTHGEGYRVWDADGNEYVDGTSSALSAICGYAHPEVTAAVTRQLGRLHHFDLSRGSHEPAGRLAERLASYLPPELSRTLFVNSGSEGFDAAMLIAAGYWQHVGTPRSRMVTFALGYHGATLLSRDLSALPRVAHPFRSPLPVTRVELPVTAAEARRPESLPLLLDAFEKAIGDDPDDVPAAVVVEPFLNVGGGIVLPPGFLRGLRDLCDARGTLLVLDEVFTAYGRSGRMFACRREDVEPDILITSKGLTSGYVPLAAVTVQQRIHESFGRDPILGGIRYGHTNSGHAVACAAALATLDVLDRENLVARAEHYGTYLRARLAGLTGADEVTDVRGTGLAVVVETRSGDTAAALLVRAQARGLLLRPQGPEGKAVLIAPPLILDAEGAEFITDRLERSLADIAG
ncbi:aspartate aminotransferase family protein [Streptomyces sp. Ru87]|uniref:aminotransferase family protein n=2 Tax=unclassified Streptomyces TaxID=2593676 RepID=UPI000BFA3129|nr:aminotransferase class III-fold pyridoxal phosphate-dependent enzyme [Streptomyces sp. Ru87]PGH46877.1 aspartate aminotransferase family protein [Streptomyces sp. Ru87]